jgi:ABC-type multidrug transport system ATPase subunit
VVHGKKLVATRLQDIAFARKVGYAQQQDLHLNSTTVREALEFSALLRQPPQYTRAAKLAWVDRVIALLDMDNDGFATAVIGVPGEGLNVEQRKRLTIGVELAARPELLLFLDEPTSGLDSTSAMSIVRLLRRLADNGQAILCVVHQPSTPLLAHFDRLLMLSEGKMIYFGALGDNFKIVTTYFERHGAPKLPEGHNPAEWILELANKPIKRDEVETTWTDIWKHSSERSLVKSECEKLELELAGATPETSDEKRASRYATGLWNQIIVLTKRAFQHDWRSPAYIWSKFFTTFGVVGSQALHPWFSCSWKYLMTLTDLY